MYLPLIDCLELDCASSLVSSSLEMLAVIHLAEEGILRLIFAAVYLMLEKVSNDNEISAASRYDASLLGIFYTFSPLIPTFWQIVKLRTESFIFALFFSLPFELYKLEKPTFLFLWSLVISTPNTILLFICCSDNVWSYVFDG